MLDESETSFDANLPIYGRLLEYRPGSTDLGPGLAQSVEISADGTVVTFHLRPGVAWQSNAHFTPTRTFDADDVIFSFERQWKDGNPYHAVSGGTYPDFAAMGLDHLITAITAPDPMTVRFTLAHSFAPFLADVAMDFAPIQSKEYADALLKAGHPELLDTEPIGTGPFSLVGYQAGNEIRYRAFPRYWQGRAKLDQLVFSITPDPAERLAKLRAGECQVMAYPSLADLPGIRADATLRLAQSTLLDVAYLAFNTATKPFDDVRVRRALSMAIDRPAILREVYRGGGVLATTLLPPTLWGQDPEIPAYPYDPAAARRLLAAAGYPHGFATELWAMTVERPYNPDALRVAQLLQAGWAAIGVEVKLVTPPWDSYRQQLAAGLAPMAEYGWTAATADPDAFLPPLASCPAADPGGSNIAKWCDPIFDALIDGAARFPDPEFRRRLYDDAQWLLHLEVPLYPIAHAIGFVPMRRNVTGYVASPLGRHAFDNVDLQR